MLIEIKAGHKLPRHSSFDDDATARAFWRLTFDTGRKYLYGKDAHGMPVLPKHERESSESYDRRRSLTKPRNHSGPLIRRYNNHVFRNEAERSEAPEGSLYALIMDDADGHGTPLQSFMAKALLNAQINRECYIMPDSTKDESDDEATQAQANEAGYRQFLRIIDADCVLNWCEYDDALTEVLCLFYNDDGSQFARQYNDTHYIEYALSKDGTVMGIGEETAHEYPALPFVRLRPFCNESQISPLAELQKSATWILSLLMEEFGNITFSQIVASGVSASDVKDVTVGNSRWICLPGSDAKFDVIGADPAQAGSLRQGVIDEQSEIYRISGVSFDEQNKAAQPESGIAKAFKHNDLSANLSALAQSVQDSENLAVDLLFTAAGEEYPGDCRYPDDFDLPNISDDLTEMVQALTLQALPNTIKRKMAANFAKKHLALDEQDQTSLNSELQNIGNDPLINPTSRTAGT